MAHPPSRRQQAPGLLFVVLGLALLSAFGGLGCEGCLKRAPLEASRVTVLDYPSCPGVAELPDGVVLASGHLRAGPTMRDQTVVEWWELRQRACLYVMTVRQDWPLGSADVEVIYDSQWRPIRAWKRLTMPGVRDADGRPDIRLYELRNDPPTMTRQSEEGREHFFFRNASASTSEGAQRVVAVVGPGRGIIGAWIRQNPNMSVGDIVRGQVLDFRTLLENVDEVALRRDPDMNVDGLGPVRVYTIFGRESVFTDTEGNVLGDLAGLRTNASLDTPEPEPQPRFGEPDPVGTP